jgi:hypothetical protein
VNALAADYAEKHADPGNLALHAATVPFAVGALLTLAACAFWPAAVALAAVSVLLVGWVDWRAALFAAPPIAALAAAAEVAARHPLAAAITSAALLPVAFAVQGLGHRRERVRPQLAGPVDAIWRLFREQIFLAPLHLSRLVIGRRPAVGA